MPRRTDLEHQRLILSSCCIQACPASICACFIAELQFGNALYLPRLNRAATAAKDFNVTGSTGGDPGPLLKAASWNFVHVFTREVLGAVADRSYRSAASSRTNVSSPSVSNAALASLEPPRAVARQTGKSALPTMSVMRKSIAERPSIATGRATEGDAADEEAASEERAGRQERGGG